MFSGFVRLRVVLMRTRLTAPSPALIISLVALFVALGGTTAYASGLISGKQIVNHLISAKKLTAAAVDALKGERGPGWTRSDRGLLVRY